MLLEETIPTHIDADSNDGQIYEQLIRDDPRLDTTIRDESHSIETIQRLLGVSVVGFLIYGAAVGVAAQLFVMRAARQLEIAAWLGHLPIVTVPLALTSAFLIALLVCLPSFYFYTQLSGLDASFRLITAQALRVQARTSVLLLGALPVYVALMLGVLVGFVENASLVIVVGLALPFLVGLAGLRSLYRSFARLARTLGAGHARRPFFLSWVVLAWAAVYSVVAPVALYRVGELLVGLVGR